jgi:kynurenine formamidase
MRLAQPKTEGTTMKRLATLSALLLAAATPAAAQQHWITGFDIHDLTHPIPLFEATGGDMTKPNLDKPFKNSRPTAGFGFQPVRVMKSPFGTQRGFFQWANIYLDEHSGTHVDSTDHYQNAPGQLSVSRHDNRSTEDFGTKDIVGPIVFIDISDRVARELAKNGGNPSPDPRVTNFSDDTPNTVSADDIAKVEGQIAAGSWLVIRTGWDKFFFGRPPENPFLHPYNNGLNYPGMTAAAVAKLKEIEDRKNVRINGIAMDNLSIDSGHSGRGPDNNPNGRGWYAHHEGLQRGWKFIENATNLGALAGTQPGQCALILGSLKLVSASGAPARVLAMCRRS